MTNLYVWEDDIIGGMHGNDAIGRFAVSAQGDTIEDARQHALSELANVSALELSHVYYIRQYVTDNVPTLAHSHCNITVEYDS